MEVFSRHRLTSESSRVTAAPATVPSAGASTNSVACGSSRTVGSNASLRSAASAPNKLVLSQGVMALRIVIADRIPLTRVHFQDAGHPDGQYFVSVADRRRL